MKIELGMRSVPVRNDGMELTAGDVRESRVFQKWLDGLPTGRHTKVVVNYIDYWGGSIHSLHIVVDGGKWEEHFILRSETVDVLTIITDGVRERIVLVEQYRASVRRKIVSNPAGGVEDGELIEAAASREVQQELGFDKEVWRELCANGAVRIEPHVPATTTASPGMLNELVHFLRAVITLPPEKFDQLINDLEGKHTGEEEEGEDITVFTVPYEDALGLVMSEEIVDAKSVLSQTYDKLR